MTLRLVGFLSRRTARQVSGTEATREILSSSYRRSRRLYVHSGGIVTMLRIATIRCIHDRALVVLAAEDFTAVEVGRFLIHHTWGDFTSLWSFAKSNSASGLQH